MNDEHSERVIARALQEVSARRGAVHRQHRSGMWSWFLPALVLAVLVLFVAAPGPLPQKLNRAMDGVCGLRPSHSYFEGGIQLPLEARMTGIYGGFTLTLMLLLVSGRLGARRLSSRSTISILVLFFTMMVFDGIDSTLAELNLPYLYTPTNLLRLLTGLLSGIALAPFLVWLLGVVALPRTRESERPVIQSRWELVAPLALNTLFVVLIMQEYAILYYPVALISVVGVVGVLAIVALLVILSISGQAGQVTRLRQVTAPGALAILVAFGVLAGTAALR